MKMSFTKCQDELVKENAMGVACGTGMRDEKGIQSFGRKS